MKHGEAWQRRRLHSADVKHILKVMRQLSAEAERADAADMTLDEINAEIDACRNGR